MMNLDSFSAKKEELLANISNAVSANDAEAMKESISAWGNFMTEEFNSAKAEFEASADRNVLAARGVRQLTAEETKYYEGFIKTAKASAADGVITNLPANLPQTVITSVLDDLRTNHPLLGMIDFQSTAAAIKWVFNDKSGQDATWGDINTAITTALEGAIDTIDLSMFKLSAYMFCTEDMLDLGPAWVDSYVRATLAEALANGLEKGIVDGSGYNCPVGMTRDFSQPFVNTGSNKGYPRKTAVQITDFGVDTFADILDTLGKTRLGNPRDVAEIVLLVNPADYYKTVMKCTTVLSTDNKTYINNVFPYPTTVIRSVGVPTGNVVFGIAKNYKMFLGTSKGGKLEKSDEYKFLEDLRTYKIKLHGNGRALDINSFVLADISKVAPVFPTVQTVVKGTVSTKASS